MWVVHEEEEASESTGGRQVLRRVTRDAMEEARMVHGVVREVVRAFRVARRCFSMMGKTIFFVGGAEGSIGGG